MLSHTKTVYNYSYQIKRHFSDKEIDEFFGASNIIKPE